MVPGLLSLFLFVWNILLLVQVASSGLDKTAKYFKPQKKKISPVAITQFPYNSTWMTESLRQHIPRHCIVWWLIMKSLPDNQAWRASGTLQFTLESLIPSSIVQLLYFLQREITSASFPLGSHRKIATYAHNCRWEFRQSKRNFCG